MAGIQGTNIVAPVVPLDTADVHPTHEALYGKGGYRTVATTVERDAIPAARREEGMLVHVAADSTAYRLGEDLTTWTVFNTGGGGGGSLEYANLAAFPATGTAAVIYVARDTNRLYRWSGSAYVELIAAPSAHTHTDYEVYVPDSGTGTFFTGDYLSEVIVNIDNAIAERAAASHTHGNLTNTGAIGSTSGLPVVTGASGVLAAGSFGTAVGSVCQGNDARLSDARTPTSHAASHASGGADAITVAQSQVTGLTTDLAGKAASDHNHGAITPDGRIGDQPGKVVVTSEFGELAVTNALTSGQLPNATTAARGGVIVGTGLGVTSGTVSVTYGTTSTTACRGDDARLSDPRTPTSHVHGNITNAGAIGTTANVPIITTTSGVLAAGSFGTAASTFCQGNDARLSDPRTPASHVHGNITNAGAIGSASGQIVVTTTSGVLTTAASIASTAVTGLGTLATQSGTFSGTSSGTNTGDQTITLTGDITGSGTGSFTTSIAAGAIVTADLANSAVTYAKIQNVSATDRILGRSTAGAGVVEEIICTAFGRSLIDDADAATARTTLGLATVASSGSASDITTGTLPRAQYARDLGSGSMTVSGSNSHGVSLDATARTLSQANTLSIMGGSLGLGTLTPLSQGLEISQSKTTDQRQLLRLRNPAATNTSYVDFIVGTPGAFDSRFAIQMNGTTYLQFAPDQGDATIYARPIRMPSSISIINDNNGNAFLTLNNGSGVLVISNVNATAFQRSQVEVGRWDDNSVWNVGTGHASAASSGGSSVTGTQARVRFPGQVSSAAGMFAAAGDAQASRYHLRNSTSDATPTTLFRNGSSTRLIVPARSTWAFKVRVTAYNSTDEIGAAWDVAGAIRRNAASGTALLGSVTSTAYTEGAMSDAVVAVTADDTNEALQISVTGLASKIIRWHAVVETSEVSAGTPS